MELSEVGLGICMLVFCLHGRILVAGFSNSSTFFGACDFDFF